MKTTKRITSIFIAFLVLMSAFAGCSKDGGDKDTANNTTVSSDKEDEPAKTTQEDKTQSPVSTKAGDIIYFGQYEQDNDLTNGKEPIAWRVLAVENGKAFLLADKILDAKPYNEENKDVTWETCTLRTWLNNDFYNAAFTSAEQEKILTTDVTNEDNPENGTSGGNNTNDKVFLLSYSDITKTAYGFSTEWRNDDSGRRGQGTIFAKSSGLYVESDDTSSKGDCAWWLRSPGFHPNDAGAVRPGGSAESDGDFDGIDYTYIGVRPALCINL